MVCYNDYDCYRGLAEVQVTACWAYTEIFMFEQMITDQIFKCCPRLNSSLNVKTSDMPKGSHKVLKKENFGFVTASEWQYFSGFSLGLQPNKQNL